MDDKSQTTNEIVPDWRRLAMAQGKIIERMANALRRIRDMEPSEFDQCEVAREALNEGE